MNQAHGVEQDRFDLVRSFLSASSAILLLGMVVVGLWVSARIEEAASENVAATAALQVDAVVGPLSGDIFGPGQPDAETRALLDRRLARGFMSRNLFAFKIWDLDGTIRYASDPALVGRHFPTNQGVAAAGRGEVFTEFNDLTSSENAGERASGVPLLEIYSPVRDGETGTVMGVVEFYDAASDLGDEIEQARLETFFVVGLATLFMAGLLFSVIARGGRLIAAQRTALRDKIDTLSMLLDQNRMLRDRADEATRNAAALNERVLRRVSADIHDGPMQLLAYATLRLKSSARAPGKEERGRIAAAIEDAIAELRDISRGLAIPDLEGVTPAHAIMRAASAHATRSDMRVQLDMPDVDLGSLSLAETICIYRFVQETLNNAARHGNVEEAIVKLKAQDGELLLETTDRGDGFDTARAPESLGLSGLKERVGALGGSFSVLSARGAGTTVTARLPLQMAASK